MSVSIESGMRVDLTGKPHFRFQDLAAYRSVSGQHVKEMDYCWLDAQELFMLELKAYSDVRAQARAEQMTSDQFLAYLINKTAPKVWDSLLLFSACWLPTNKGKELRQELDVRFHVRIECIRVVIVVAVPDWFKPQFETLRRRFREVLQGKMALFDSRSLIVCMPEHLVQYPALACITPIGTSSDHR
ncbi:MAG: hypothetical protein H7839_05455 [Magnetococcus sp. YQC-5]